MPDTPSTHSTPRWGAGGNPEQGEWAKDASTHSVVDMAREEIAALRHMSYSGGIDGRPWRPDLEPDDIGKIATLLAELVEQLEALQRENRVLASSAQKRWQRMEVAEEALQQFGRSENWDVMETHGPFDSFEWIGGGDPIKFAQNVLKSNPASRDS